MRNRKVLLVSLGVLLAGAASLIWLERTTLQCWYSLRCLVQADDANREGCAVCVARLGEAALPGLLDCLNEGDVRICRNARSALVCLVAQRGGWGDPRVVDLAMAVTRSYPKMSRAGQQEVLGMASEWFAKEETPPAEGLARACSRLLADSVSIREAPVQLSALELCQGLIGQAQSAEVLSAARELVRAALHGERPAVRMRAIQLALHPGMDLLEQVTGLLNDSAVEVRRAALVALGPADKVILDETLLPSLHDPDPEIQRLCEAALRARGLGPEHVQLGRWLTAPQPQLRMKVLDQLNNANDLDPAVWLRRLSHDPAPSVRVAALRVMSQQTLVDLTDRIDQMAQSDPSPTVSYLARIYLDRVQTQRPARNSGD